ncbi:MAG: hypothetical protein ACFE0O_08630 [Opitutales bacterium]
MRNDRPAFEETLTGVFAEASLRSKLLVGGLLCFLPGLHLFAFGWLARLLMRTRHGGRLEALPFEPFPETLVAGLRLTVIFLVVPGIPLSAGILIGWALAGLTGGLLGWIGWLVGVAGAVIGLTGWACAIDRWLAEPDSWRCLKPDRLFRETLACFQPLLVPVVGLTGLVFLLSPLYGPAGFLALVALSLHSQRLFRLARQRADDPRG